MIMMKSAIEIMLKQYFI